MKTAERGGRWTMMTTIADGCQVPTYVFRNRTLPAVAKELLPFSLPKLL